MKSPAKIALAKAHERACWNTMVRHRTTCAIYSGVSSVAVGSLTNCLICRNVYDEWNIAMRRLAEMLES